MLAHDGEGRRFDTGRENPFRCLLSRLPCHTDLIGSMMSVLEARCVYRGATFFGTIEVTGIGSGETVHVRYDGDCIEAKTVGLDAAIVAPTLLRELVMERSMPIGRKRVAGSPSDRR